MLVLLVTIGLHNKQSVEILGNIVDLGRCMSLLFHSVGQIVDLSLNSLQLGIVHYIFDMVIVFPLVLMPKLKIVVT